MRRAGVLVREGCLHGHAQGSRPTSAATGCGVRHQRHGCSATICLLRGRAHRRLFCRPDQRPVPPHQGAQGGGGEDRFLLSLPAEEAGGSGEGEILGEQACPLLQGAGGDDAAVCGQRCIARHDVHAALPVGEHLAWQLHGAQTAGHGDRLVPIALHLARWEASAVGVHQVGIDRLPLRLEGGAEHGVANVNGRCFQRIEYSLRGEGSGLNLREVDCGDLNQVIWVLLIKAADQDADMAHGGSFGRRAFAP
jgi:hypothetical protein